MLQVVQADKMHLWRVPIAVVLSWKSANSQQQGKNLRESRGESRLRGLRDLEKWNGSIRLRTK